MILSFKNWSYESFNLCFMRISVVIPCYNEEESIAKVIESIPEGVHEVLVVDNNSTDGTAAKARERGARVVFEPKQGYGSALKAGFCNASGEVIATLDGDCQYPAELILEMAKFLEEERLDFLSGNRFPLKIKGSINRTRIVGNKLFTVATNLIFPIRVKDSQSGMWVFRKKVLDHINLESDDMPLSQEIKIKVATHPSLKFAEYHIPYYPRTGESKLLPVKHGFINLYNLLKLRLTHKRPKRS